MTTDRDSVVGALLDRLPVDPPAPGFWADLEARLQGELVEIGPEPARERRDVGRRRVAVVVLAAAAVLVAIVVGSALRDERDDLDTRPPVSQPDDQTDVTRDPAIPMADAVLDVAIQWMDAVAHTDIDEAWALLGPQSVEAIGGRAAFENLMASSEFQGEWAQWADLMRGSSFVGAAPLLPDHEHEDWVVTVMGAEFDGHVATTALIATHVQGMVFVEPFLPGLALQMVDLPPGRTVLGELGPPTVPAGTTIPVQVEPGAAYAVAIDGDAVPEAALERDTEGMVTGVRTDLDDGGHHTVTVAMRTSSGALAAQPVVFVASGGSTTTVGG